MAMMEQNYSKRQGALKKPYGYLILELLTGDLQPPGAL